MREDVDRRAIRLLFVVNVGWFFLSHRLPVAIAAKAAGYEVHVATALDPNLDAGTPALLEQHGIVLHRLRLSRSGAHPLELLRDFRELVQLYRLVMPDIIHLVALKPLLLGGIAAKIMKFRRTVMAVPGRGSVFSARGVAATLRRWVALLMYRIAYAKGRSRVIIQNIEDKEYFVRRRVFSDRDITLIRGSGVDVNFFSPEPEPRGPLRVLFASRMLREKGVEDFVAVARLLKSRGSTAEFVLVGEPDRGNPHSHTRDELTRWALEGAVQWWGHRADMNAVFSQMHIVCLPTYYGEGVPKVLIEAAACGRPIITTDIPGCRDIVRNDCNGLLIKPRDIHGLAHALDKLLSSPDLRSSFGRAGRQIVESEFSVDRVARQTLALYHELVN